MANLFYMKMELVVHTLMHGNTIESGNSDRSYFQAVPTKRLYEALQEPQLSKLGEGTDLPLWCAC
jgi:hypothetical protein